MIELSDGTSLEADVVIMATGARPNMKPVRDAGPTIGPRGGIVATCAKDGLAPEASALEDI